MIYQSFRRQSIGDPPSLTNNELAEEKCLHPKNPAWAESGEGCADSNTWWIDWSTIAALFRAYRPQRINTKPFLDEDNLVMTESVNTSHPFFWCDPAWPSLTDSVAFNNKTPCFAQLLKSPDWGIWIPQSLLSSLKMFLRDGGWGIPLGTEKLKPWAWPGPW